MEKIKFIALIAILAAFIGCAKEEIEPTTTAPSISAQTFSVAENADIGASIGIIAASDADKDPLSFNIIAGNSEGTFLIEVSTGELTLAKRLDFETTDTYSLEVQVTDGRNNAEATITVNVTPQVVTISTPGFPTNSFFDGRLADADYWSEQPEILSAGLGFCDIVGIEVGEITEALVESIDGAWASNIDCEDVGSRTFTNTRTNMEQVFIVQNPYADEFKDGAIGLDALPMTFTWPVRTNTIDLSDFRITVSNGDVVIPSSAGVFPNGRNQ